MKSNWRGIAAIACMLVLVGTIVGGCTYHGGGHSQQVDVVDPHGYHHQGYYDDNHAWHGGYDDENHVHHDDPPDWHQ